MDANALILPASKEERRKFFGVEAASVAKPKKVLSKRAQRKIVQLEKRRRLESLQAELEAELAKTRLPAEIYDKLRGTSEIVHVDKRAKRRKIKRNEKEECYVEEQEEPSATAMEVETSEPVVDVIHEQLFSVEASSPTETLVLSLDNLLARREKDAEDAKIPIPAFMVPATKTDALLLTPVKVERTKKIEEARMKLPAAMHEQDVVEALRNHDVILVTGGTGCGKSTQVPQFLLDAGFCTILGTGGRRIAVTQPRRVAVTAVCSRLAEELNNPSMVGYQVRHDRSVNTKTCAIKVMTDGILMRELRSDFLLREYSVVVIDEAHERSVNCDVLLGLLSRIVQQRRKLWDKDESMAPLRLVIMSATLRQTDFTANVRLFSHPPPVIDIDSKAHSVSLHFMKKTPSNIVKAAAEKVRQIHNRLPPGSILVFLTGKREVLELCAALQKKSKKQWIDDDRNFLSEEETGKFAFSDEENGEEDEQAQITEGGTETFANSTNDSVLETENSTTPVDFNLDTEDLRILRPDAGTTISEKETAPALQSKENTAKWLGGAGSTKLTVVPLYALLSLADQRRAFRQPSANERIVVVATNVAETSLTLPNIRYVVDGGKEKRRIFLSSAAGASSVFRVQWVSKASADQRAGRAGRLGPGHCYRLYSPAIFDNFFTLFPPVQVLSVPLDNLALYLVSLGVSRLTEFPFPTPPTAAALKRSQSALLLLGAVERQSIISDDVKITDLGRLMAELPVTPRLAFLLINAISLARVQDSTPQASAVVRAAAALVAGWSVVNLHVAPVLKKGEKLKFKKRLPTSDIDKTILTILTVKKRGTATADICEELGCMARPAEEAVTLYDQLCGIIKASFFHKVLESDPEFTDVPASLSDMLHECAAVAFRDCIAVRCDVLGRGMNKRLYIATGEANPLTIHSSSATKSVGVGPEILGFHQIVAEERLDGSKIFTLRDCFPINRELFETLDCPLKPQTSITSTGIYELL